jgi:predicted deacylase
MTPTTPPRRRRDPFVLGDLSVAAGRAATTELPISRLVTGTEVSLPVRVVHGRADGPTIWISAAVHGDEIAGVEIIRRVLDALDPRSLAGTVLAVPIVNVHGFLHGDRYLPDRRDLNRSFPGSPNGSLAARIAHLFMSEIVSRCTVGIDLHTGSDDRTNLPQIRADLDDPTTRRLAVTFGAPVALHSRLRDGSMRAAATARGATVLLYEGGEASRFDREAIATGVDGVGRVLAELGMTATSFAPPARPPIECRQSRWVRARRSGIAQLSVELGDRVEGGATLAPTRDALGRRVGVSRAPRAGIVIGHTQHPLVNQGDALVHLAEPDEPSPSASSEGIE